MSPRPNRHDEERKAVREKYLREQAEAAKEARRRAEEAERKKVEKK